MRQRALRLLGVVIVLSLGAGAVRMGAHDLPADVIAQLFVKPEGRTLHVLVRVPLRAMGDVDYPTRGAAGTVDLARIDRALRDAVAMWIRPAIQLSEDGRPLEPLTLRAVRLSLPSDRSFGSYDHALANIDAAPLPPETTIEWNQGLLDAALDVEIRSDRSRFAIDLAVARLGVRVVTAVRFLPPGGRKRKAVTTRTPSRATARSTAKRDWSERISTSSAASSRPWFHSIVVSGGSGAASMFARASS